MKREELIKQYRDKFLIAYTGESIEKLLENLIDEIASHPEQEAVGVSSDIAKYQKYEVVDCECGHTAPYEFTQSDGDCCDICINCVNDILIDRLGKKNKQIKSLKNRLKEYQLKQK